MFQRIFVIKHERIIYTRTHKLYIDDIYTMPSWNVIKLLLCFSVPGVYIKIKHLVPQWRCVLYILSFHKYINCHLTLKVMSSVALCQTFSLDILFPSFSFIRWIINSIYFVGSVWSLYCLMFFLNWRVEMCFLFLSALSKRDPKVENKTLLRMTIHC